MTPLIMVIAAAQVVVQAMALVMVYLMALLLAMAKHNHGIGNGNGDDVDITAPITGVLISLVTLSPSLAIHLLVQLILPQLQRPIQLMTMT